MQFPALVRNETLKLIRRRRFLIVLSIMVAVIGLISYGQYRQLERRGEREWRVVYEQRVARYENMLRRGRINESWARSLRAEVDRLHYYLDRDIDPERPTAPYFARNFASAAGFLLLPLLIAVLGSDIVSAEAAEGTNKLLLTRPVRRWKILMSKITALALFTTITLFLGGLFSWLISSIALDPRGWDAPVFAGFQFSPEGLEFEEVRVLPLWLDTIIAYGLEWFALLSVAAIAILLSVLFRSSAASIGTMLACLIAGTILTRVSPDWTAGKYLFVSGLPLAAYYSGQAPPYEGM
ncbi:MAG: ABC transporter permease subunit, partial [Thermoanaerobaculia bacterium]|nr:ABC transporter permease subunit [Thermoanaerobaculia bacterium]